MKTEKRRKNSLKNWFWVIIVPAVIAIILRVFFIAIYKVPSLSMEPVLLSGDIIIVSKTSYGPRLLNFVKYLKQGEIEHIRLNGQGLIKKHDIVVFKMPLYNMQFDSVKNKTGDCIAKRIYGNHGDVVLIDNKEISYNGFAQFQVEKLLFPLDTSLHWSLDKYGPLYVPEKGEKILLTSKNVSWYNDILLSENPNGMIKDSTLFIDGESFSHYTFKSNYYFMLGDNFYSSYDSRYWGFVPEDNIIGKVVMVIYSVDPNKAGLKKIRWNRFFKAI